MTEEEHDPSEEEILLIESATLAMMEHVGIDPADPKNEAHMDENAPGSEINTYKELAVVALEAILSTANRIDSITAEHTVDEDMFQAYQEDHLDNHTKEPEVQKHPKNYKVSSILSFTAESEGKSEVITLGDVRRFVADLDRLQAADSLEVWGYLDTTITRDLLKGRGFYIECGDCGATDVIVEQHECEYEGS